VVRIGLRVPEPLFDNAGALREAVAAAEDGRLDALCVGDHVTFHGGRGQDGLVQAAALAVLARRAEIVVAVYQLQLRHPVVVARQVCDLARLAPAGFSLGVGVGGEDRDESWACGVDPAQRGRRTDESLTVLRRLLAGEVVAHTGPCFDLRDVAVSPTPANPVPILVGGRSDAALRRAARHGDGWLGVWVSPERFAASCAAVEEQAALPGRSWRHGLQVWCGLGSRPEDAHAALRATMEGLYRIPFERFARWCPTGRPEDVAEFVDRYRAVGAHDINLIAVAASPIEAVEGAARVRALLD
jgi:alkanesulfonate monooxygenase SsuD/methylene tetrahydromethanopterin reductase-like flavin-dependent oxidoreductase (luciferase family)